MIVGMGIIFTSFIFITTIAIIYFKKQKIKNTETTLYSVLLILNIINLILEFWLCVNILLDVELYSFYNLILNRAFLSFLFAWFVVFLTYIFIITFNANNRVKEKLANKYGKNYISKMFLRIFPIIFIVCILLVTLPIDLINDGTYAYSDGPAVYVLYVVLVLAMLVCFYCIYINRKSINYYKLIPLIGFIVCFGVVFIGRQIIPGLLLNSFCLSFATLLMYNTIENPDVKMIKDLTQAKEATEQSNNNKSAFIFNVVNKIRGPINNFKRIGDELTKENDIKEMKKGVNVLLEEAKRLEYLINNVLDISNVDVKNLKIVKNKYNFNNLTKGIVNNFNIKTKQKEFEFRVNIEKDIPTNLYGDSIRLKQIINTLLDNAYKYTEKGFIELRISAVTRFEVCRLIIVVEDSGKGMDVTKSNKVLYDYGQDIDLEKIEKENMNLPIVKKLVDLIGGSIMLKSEENKGTEVILTLDQKIVEKEDEKTYQIKQPKILFIDDDEKYYNEFLKLTKHDDITYVFASGGQKGLEHIRKEETFDLIIMNADLEKLSSVNTLEKLTKEEQVKSPIVVLTKKSEGNKHQSLGFTDYIEKPITKEKIDKIIKKYM